MLARKPSAHRQVERRCHRRIQRILSRISPLPATSQLLHQQFDRRLGQDQKRTHPKIGGANFLHFGYILRKVRL